MKKYCCRELHELEDDSWQRGFGLNVVEKDKVEIFCMDEQVTQNALMNIPSISVPFVVIGYLLKHVPTFSIYYDLFNYYKSSSEGNKFFVAIEC